MATNLPLNNDTRELMEGASAICRRFHIACIEPAVLFMAIQQRYANELAHFLTGIGINPDTFYPRVAQSMNGLERCNVSGSAVRVSPTVLKAL